MEHQIFFPMLSLGAHAFLPGALTNAIDVARKAGYTGIEVPQWWWARSSREAEVNSLKFPHTFHEVWSLKDNETHLFSKGLHMLNLLPPDRTLLSTQFKEKMTPIVAYADRYKQAVGNEHIWLQTCSAFEDGRKKPKFRITYQEFEENVMDTGLSVVFDVQHFLEFRLNKTSVTDLLNRDKIEHELEVGWKHLQPFVKEIHLTNFDPKLGHTKGRNVGLKKGFVDLVVFARMVKESGWTGNIVPEVQPKHLGINFWSFDQTVVDAFTHLREEVEEIFS